VVCHHDAGGNPPGSGDQVPPVIIHGRPDLDGPLAQVWLEVDGDCHVVAAGRANHAGAGNWRGLTSNSQVWGIEANNTGFAPWPDEQLEAWYKLCAALGQFSGFSPGMVCGHKEWAPGRKPDPHSLDMDAFRRKVATATKGDDFLSAEEVRQLQETIVNQSNQQEATMRNQGEKTRDAFKEQVDRLIAAIRAD
jgi:N-acetyl-anhydromuramyl-L-alanine amidase AmpD